VVLVKIKQIKMNYNIKVGESFSFSKEAFTNGFSDIDGDNPCEVLILSLPDENVSQLNYNGKKVIVGDCFPINNSNLLTFFRKKNTAINTSFNFKISDNNQNKLYSNMAKVLITIAAHINLPPSQVGDLTVSINHGSIRTFTKADFTTGLNPPYKDPEGDQPSKLKILGLTASGKLKLNGVDVIINQEIDFSSIESGLFIYSSDTSNTQLINTEFDFSISDTGSGKFTS
jgi:hypothetical protein